MASAFLAIEGSQRSASVAVRQAPGAPVHEHAVPPSTDHADHLMAVIDAACRSAGIGPSDLAAIAVSIGPGGFTGLRVSCATAKAIADVTGCALVPVPSALVAARECVRQGLLGDGDCTVALASKGQDAWCTLVSVREGMPAAGAAALAGAEGAAITGPLVADQHLPSGLAARAPAGTVAARWSATACLEVGERLHADGVTADPLSLAPVYPRPPEAVTLWEARHGPKER
jgi:tRNA threonylcarbamoyladenosine biosynthesis protein TsaB